MTEMYRRGSIYEHAAREILKSQGFYVIRCVGHASPPDLFAARRGDFRMVMIRHSRFPVPDAHTIAILYAEDLDRFRRLGWSTCVRFECWIHGIPSGWRYYEVFPGGIRRITQEWEIPGDSCSADEAGFENPGDIRAGPRQEGTLIDEQNPETISDLRRGTCQYTTLKINQIPSTTLPADSPQQTDHLHQNGVVNHA